MRTLCDVCEAAAARLFCASDEAALCLSCDEKVHGCNKLASRHVRVELAGSRAVPRCDICENAPAFFFCSIDGTSLCLQCDMDVHIGKEKTHERYLLMGQRVEFIKTPSQEDASKDAANLDLGKLLPHHHHHEENKRGPVASGNWNDSDAPAVALTVGKKCLESQLQRTLGNMIDLNSRPSHLQQIAHTAKDQELASSDDDTAGVVPQMPQRSSDGSD